MESWNQVQHRQKKKTRGGVISNLKDDVDNLLREVVGDYKNDKKTKKNLNEEDLNDEEVLLS